MKKNFLSRWIESLEGRRAPIFMLLGSNMLPLLGVLFAGWDVTAILLLYWIENIVIGLFNVVKMLSVRLEDGERSTSRFFTAGFFILHYGGFTAVHGIILFHLLGLSDGESPLFPPQEWGTPLQAVHAIADNARRLWEAMPGAWAWGIAALVLSHGVSLVLNYFMGGERQLSSLKRLMNEPYNRVIVLHVVLIAGGMLIDRLGSPVYLLVALVLVKIRMDIHLHIREHERKRAKPEATSVA
jgi:hypothetical protein